MKLLALLLAAALGACSPYREDLANVEKLYKMGRFSDAEYYQIRTNILRADDAWHANLDARISAAGAAANHSMRQQQQINAYNERTRTLAAPRNDTLNVNHSGSLNVY